MVGVVAFAAFVLVECRTSHPMLPLDIFESRQFAWANVVTFAMYGGMGAVFFLLVVQLQTVLGYTPLQAGVASLPVALLLFVLSPRAGAMAQRIGARLPMTVGPAVAVLPAVVGLTGGAYSDAVVFAQGFADAMLISGTVVASGGVLAFFVIDRPSATAVAEADTRPQQEIGGHCDLCGPPLRRPPATRR